ncbi:helix-turn-helix domain-containing protein [Haloarchaeobius litoreus]|uniref:Helix-turn-helix domain-containing protein n=1 Tax=Haloarchaeobius litoreus TaxID=755306 RepID=A0ABD6DP47_9EURY|nr:helix-turn-helix domain-containing protein [Haloarchaeobius litoreus]
MDDTHLREGAGNDRLLDLLADRHRRQVLVTLAGASEPLTVDELSELLSDVDETQVERARLELHHTHLPKLEAAGLVEYDPENQSVTLAGSADELTADIKRAAAILHELVVKTRQGD